MNPPYVAPPYPRHSYRHVMPEQGANGAQQGQNVGQDMDTAVSDGA